MRNCFTLSLDVLARRTIRFRNLAVAVAILGLAAPIAAIAAGTWLVLLALLALLPLCAASFARDAALVARWRRAILDEWTTGNFDLDSFAAMFAAIPVLPARTLAAMLDPLPTRRRLGEEHRPPIHIRAAISDAVRAVDWCQIWRARFEVARSAGIAVGIAAAVLAESVWPLAVIPILWVIKQGIVRLFERRVREWSAPNCGEPWTPEEVAHCRALIARLDGRGGSLSRSR